MAAAFVEVYVYIVGGVCLLLVAYCLCVVFHMRRKLDSVANFAHGEVFSGQFYQALRNYLGHPDNARALMEPTLPYLRQLVAENR